MEVMATKALHAYVDTCKMHCDLLRAIYGSVNGQTDGRTDGIGLWKSPVSNIE